MKIGIYWFRNDLRTHHNPGLNELCSVCDQIIPLYILDNDPANPWPLGGAQRWWLHHSLSSLDQSLKSSNQQLILRIGKYDEQLLKLASESGASHVFWSRPYEPFQMVSENKLTLALKNKGLITNSFNSYLLTEPGKILNQSGQPFKIYTPFKRFCLTQINPNIEISCDLKSKKMPSTHSVELDDLRLLPKTNWAKQFSDRWSPGESGANAKLEKFIEEGLLSYSINRNFPAINSTSELSPHLHFGEISADHVWSAVQSSAIHHKMNQQAVDTFLSQLLWREFSYHLLFHFPDLPEKNFRDKFDGFAWESNHDYLQRWQEGRTGYPIVDAGMRELWQTGFMHNRVRMITASFLTKDLLLHWSEGEKWFWDTLVDADLANNAASWQWVAGSGVDAAPYFRIFNPTLQGQKFDPEGKYIKKWIPELNSVPVNNIHTPWRVCKASQYPHPVVDHALAREKALRLYRDLNNFASPLVGEAARSAGEG